MCSREIATYRRQQGADAVAWIDASSCPESALGSDLSRDSALGRFHVRQPDGTLVDGMRGFATLWRALPRFAWLGRIASVWPVPIVLDAGYRGFLVVRRVWRRPAAASPR